MIYIDADHLSDGLYNVKDGKIYKYKAKGGTVRTYELRNIIRCGERKHFHKEGITDKSYYCKQFHDRNGYWREVNADDFCSRGEREGE